MIYDFQWLYAQQGNGSCTLNENAQRTKPAISKH